MNGAKSAAGRLAFIDWTRGLAAVVMIQGHVFHSFTRTDLRDKGPFMLSQLLGGLPPAMFLFLTGITFAFLMHGEEKREASSWQRVLAALKRSRYLLMLAFLFRLQLYVFGFPTSPAVGLLKVDILNCMGFAMLLFAPMAVFSTRERIRLCTVLGLLIAGLAPLVSSMDMSAIPAVLQHYLVPNLEDFGFFPWASFLAFGMAAGSVLRAIKPEDMSRAMLWMLAVALALITGAHYASDLPYSFYTKSDFWLNSPWLTLIKLGVTLAVLSAAYLWIQLGTGVQRWSVFVQLGTTSLLVYWVHIEIVYGRWLGIWKEGLSVPQVVAFTAVLLAAMVLLSIGQTRFPQIRTFFRPASVSKPQAVSGD
ncbi:MAG TPA: acyltransferase [Bryobacteraceae bacterium]|nr:acyltransferase [Bryobacteraceae bacterium]